MVATPIFRAIKIGTEDFIEGYYGQYIEDDIVYHEMNNHILIDPNTLSIHFDSMLDKNGKKIFASLSEDGVGGDIIKAVFGEASTLFEYGEWIGKVFFNNGSIDIDGEWCVALNSLGDTSFEIIGIHKANQ